MAWSDTIEHDAVFDSVAGRTCFRDLLRQSGWGLAGPNERAAFIVQQGDGSLACQAWPSVRHYLSESFYGVVPAHTVGIVHTHPAQYPLPSLKDKDEATRIGLPIYVLSIRGVYKVVPGNDRVSTMAEQSYWLRERPPTVVSGSASASR